MISVLSLCQTTSALSITVSGMEDPFCIGGLGDYRVSAKVIVECV